MNPSYVSLVAAVLLADFCVAFLEVLLSWSMRISFYLFEFSVPQDTLAEIIERMFYTFNSHDNNCRAPSN